MPEEPEEKKSNPESDPRVIKTAVTYHENMYKEPSESNLKKRRL